MPIFYLYLHPHHLDSIMRFILEQIRFCLLVVCLFITFGLGIHAQNETVRSVVQTGHSTTIKDYDISADGKYVATLDRSNKIIIWRLKTGHQYREFNVDNSNKIYFNSHSNALLVVCGRNSVAFDIATGKRICYWS